MEKCVICERCEGTHDGAYGSGRFCSPWCAKSFGSSSWREKKKPKYCLNCQKPVRGVYCSNACQGAVYRVEQIRLWKKGKVDGVSIAYSVRRYLVELYGPKCWKCGWNEKNPVTDRVPIELNHIDGDWRNFKENNLEIICPNCHSLTPNFRALNKRKADRRVKGQRKAWAHS